MKDIVHTAHQIQEKARAVIEATGVRTHWESIGATIHLVGSLKTGLLINKRDIDFHIYTNPFSLSDSFSAIAKIAENKRIREIRYTNLLPSEDACLEWHAFYDDPDGGVWQIDMIHILEQSPYAGYFEKVAERILQVLTDETKEAILRIKSSMPIEKKVMSIQLYQAVIADGVRTVAEFWKWQEQNPGTGIIAWMP